MLHHSCNFNDTLKFTQTLCKSFILRWKAQLDQLESKIKLNIIMMKRIKNYIPDNKNLEI